MKPEGWPTSTGWAPSNTNILLWLLAHDEILQCSPNLLGKHITAKNEILVRYNWNSAQDHAAVTVPMQIIGSLRSLLESSHSQRSKVMFKMLTKSISVRHDSACACLKRWRKGFNLYLAEEMPSSNYHRQNKAVIKSISWYVRLPMSRKVLKWPHCILIADCVLAWQINRLGLQFRKVMKH